jgi:putative transposase
MGSQPRLIADGLVYHALKRGNNRARVFFDDADFQQFLHALAQTKERYPFRLFAYCLMDNHYHLVREPAAGQSISRILQSLTVAHIWHYHKAAASSGHVWQGRFKSPVVSAGKKKVSGEEKGVRNRFTESSLSKDNFLCWTCV